jgi:F0F1-type ATP synthase gamma subunit
MIDDQQDPAQVERRIHAVEATRRIVHAIWALSRAQHPLAEASWVSASTYLSWVESSLERLTTVNSASRDGAPEIAVVFGPQRSFCGPLTRQIVSQIPTEGMLGLVGRRLSETVRSEGGIAARVAFSVEGAVAYDGHAEAARRVAEALAPHARRKRVVVLSPSRNSTRLRRAVLLADTLRMKSFPAATLADPKDVIDVAIRAGIEGRLAVASAGCLLAEVSARLSAAERARRACDSRLEELRGRHATARRDQITNEIVEIIAGQRGGRRMGLPGATAGNLGCVRS